jgi:hypothetical protein
MVDLLEECALKTLNPVRRCDLIRLGVTVIALFLVTLAAWLAFSSAQRMTLGADGTPTATPACARLTEDEVSVATPAALGTPMAAVDCTETGLGTPVAVDGLELTLTAAQDKAGPVDLTIAVVDTAGEPVVDATVLILTQHLEMNHGVSIDFAFHPGDGVYQANKVSMGMGGTWQVEVQVTRPGQPPAAAVFEVGLEGPH